MFGALTRVQGLRPLRLLSFRSHVTRSRCMSRDHKPQRDALLRKVYAPFAGLNKDSPEYQQLADSGKVWEDYFRPGDVKRRGYDALQEENKDILAEIDAFRKLMKPRIGQLAKTLVTEYAHQSVVIENNPLTLGDAIAIFDALSHKLFKHVDLTSLEAAGLAQLELPNMGHDTEPDESAVVELKNHIVASQWIAENAVLHPRTPGISEKQMRDLAAMTVKGTASEVAYAHSWGGRVPLGGYRRTPISVRGNPLAVFPYHREVPACISRFFDWRDAMHADEKVHPLILACHMMAYFVHVHPFPDGNGRVSRMLVHNYVVRQGYLPVVVQNLDRNDFVRSISDAAEGDPRELVLTMLTAQLNEMRTFHWRLMTAEDGM